ncbi:IS3 family transposase [Telmatocola sphagniphila]|uniref:IS3 family transposase n=1 Tax=Telmatocola sphagniphila TaxID=1123043 RepID=A0A8E6BDB0_9BACT|nr:IS3 family transposase [Telmatocola sphagniphila]
MAYGAGHSKKSGQLLCAGFGLKYEFIEAHASTWPVKRMRSVLGVSTSGYYQFRKRLRLNGRCEASPRLLTEIRTIHAEMKERYGSPRMHAELQARGYKCCRNTVAKVMKTVGIRASMPRRFVRTTDSNHSLPVAGNELNRQFDSADAPDRLWTADITYIPTKQGWLYLAVVEDLYSRRIVGRSMDRTMESRLVVDALAMAVETRYPAEGLLAHSDRGSQYASEHYQRLLEKKGIRCGMSRRADCWDNAPMESFFASLKKELCHRVELVTRDEAKRSIFEYIEVFYNRIRRHSSLGYVSLDEYERATKIA